MGDRGERGLELVGRSGQEAVLRGACDGFASHGGREEHARDQQHDHEDRALAREHPEPRFGQLAHLLAAAHAEGRGYTAGVVGREPLTGDFELETRAGLEDRPPDDEREREAQDQAEQDRTGRAQHAYSVCTRTA